jgi:hypothetical protein
MPERVWPLSPATRIVGRWDRPSNYKTLSDDAKVRVDWVLGYRRLSWLLPQARDHCTDNTSLRMELDDALIDLVAGRLLPPMPKPQTPRQRGRRKGTKVIDPASHQRMVLLWGRVEFYRRHEKQTIDKACRRALADWVNAGRSLFSGGTRITDKDVQVLKNYRHNNIRGHPDAKGIIDAVAGFPTGDDPMWRQFVIGQGN